MTRRPFGGIISHCYRTVDFFTPDGNSCPRQQLEVVTDTGEIYAWVQAWYFNEEGDPEFGAGWEKVDLPDEKAGI